MPKELWHGKHFYSVPQHQIAFEVISWNGKLSATVLCHTSKETAESVLKMFSGYIDQRLIDGGPEGFLGINDMYKAVKMLNPQKRISRPVNLNIREISGELDQFNYLPHERSEY